MEKTRCAGMAVLALTAALLAPAAQAATRTVTSLADNGGPHTLRSLINAASKGETIVFSDDLSGTITLNCSLFPLQIVKNLTIAGPGPEKVTVSGGNACGVFDVGPNATVTISGLTIANGSSDGGGGIGNSGTLTVDHCVLKNNSSTVFGGGILNGGTLTVTNSTCLLYTSPSPRD